MARKTEENHKPDILLNIVERYYLEKNPVRRPKYSDLGKFARSLGYDIGDHIFRKSTIVRDYLDKRDCKDEKSLKMSVAVFDTLDTDRFIRINNTPSKLKKALQERDTYYRDVTLSAGRIFEKNKELESINAHAREENQKLSNDNKELIEAITKLRKDYNALKARDRGQREIIDTWVNPEIANELLKREGLLKETSCIVNKEVLDKKLVTGSSDIQGLIKSMYKGIDNGE